MKIDFKAWLEVDSLKEKIEKELEVPNALVREYQLQGVECSNLENWVSGANYVLGLVQKQLEEWNSFKNAN